MIKALKHIFKILVLFLIGATTYYFIEIAWRGYSHWTMFILGGICFILLGLINELIPWEMSIIKQGVIGSGIVTMLEFFVGLLVNVYLQWGIWDYSNMPCNICGQVCLPFSLLWILISIVAIILDDFLRYKLFKEDKPHYTLFTKK